jgi:hypothetical protein
LEEMAGRRDSLLDAHGFPSSFPSGFGFDGFWREREWFTGD